MKVYLSGGMRSGWQDTIKKACPGIKFIDPREHGLDDATKYAIWDMEGVKNSDVVFAYLEEDNPSGLGMAFEVGYGLALGKTIIFVCEKQDRYASIILFGATVTFAEFSAGIEFLKSLKRAYP